MNKVTYHRTWAFWPTRMDSGVLVWFGYYYIRPGQQGVGVLLNHREYLVELGQ